MALRESMEMKYCVPPVSRRLGATRLRLALLLCPAALHRNTYETPACRVGKIPTALLPCKELQTWGSPKAKWKTPTENRK